MSEFNYKCDGENYQFFNGKKPLKPEDILATLNNIHQYFAKLQDVPNWDTIEQLLLQYAENGDSEYFRAQVGNHAKLVKVGSLLSLSMVLQS